MNKIELTRKELTLILQVVTGHVRDFVMDNDKFIDEQLEAINYTRCCETLPTKKIMNFDDWVKFLKWQQVGNSYVYKQGNEYKDANELKQAHSKYLRI